MADLLQAMGYCLVWAVFMTLSTIGVAVLVCVPWIKFVNYALRKGWF